ncbi:hypothetical protein H0Z09_02860 [Pseudomonas sp. SWRI18]|uniref:hypothetical protein n=1 Tax=Pseudomonas sp. SWRI18 TaxID=2753888 RepID=UPI001648F5EB|nr:hypothetical protein [Pseudomonas sp. SWRI18]MBC3300055.1 hypothetical protein [Pseudomonas sp. SWRI18]
MKAGRDLTIDAAQNTFARTDMHKEKNRDLTGVLTGNKLGLDDMTGNQKLYINSSKHNGTANEMTLTGNRGQTTFSAKSIQVFNFFVMFH